MLYRVVWRGMAWLAHLISPYLTHLISPYLNGLCIGLKVKRKLGDDLRLPKVEVALYECLHG